MTSDPEARIAALLAICDEIDAIPSEEAPGRSTLSTSISSAAPWRPTMTDVDDAA